MPRVAQSARPTALSGGRLQAETVHAGVTYDLEVDTSATEALACARTIAARVV